MTDAIYPTAPGYKEHGGTSEEAARSFKPTVAALRAVALRHLCDVGLGGLTADETAGRMCCSILSVRPRISELYRMGLIQKTGERRKNGSGMAAAVWRVATHG